LRGKRPRRSGHRRCWQVDLASAPNMCTAAEARGSATPSLSSKPRWCRQPRKAATMPSLRRAVGAAGVHGSTFSDHNSHRDGPETVGRASVPWALAPALAVERGEVTWLPLPNLRPRDRDEWRRFSRPAD
jgi:hypothetical protein